MGKKVSQIGVGDDFIMALGSSCLPPVSSQQDQENVKPKSKDTPPPTL